MSNQNLEKMGAGQGLLQEGDFLKASNHNSKLQLGTTEIYLILRGNQNEENRCNSRSTTRGGISKDVKS